VSYDHIYIHVVIVFSDYNELTSGGGQPTPSPFFLTRNELCHLLRLHPKLYGESKLVTLPKKREREGIDKRGSTSSRNGLTKYCTVQQPCALLHGVDSTEIGDGLLDLHRDL
jgi:hypothetical protein